MVLSNAERSDTASTYPFAQPITDGDVRRITEENGVHPAFRVPTQLFSSTARHNEVTLEEGYGSYYDQERRRRSCRFSKPQKSSSSKRPTSTSIRRSKPLRGASSALSRRLLPTIPPKVSLDERTKRIELWLAESCFGEA
ncbi:hypothetical protein PT974_01410 [Cladobotryum mycophilum]|uniref:Uncharacterized protein n=1 Tax=Cladobotryum mycophilum TaxID=491253 RepID=A0ABR0T3J6_9HYPO